MNTVTIQGDDRHHMANVMRFQPGDQVVICQPDETSHIGVIDQIHPEEIKITLLEELDEQKELPITVTVAQGMPKGDKLELIAQKGQNSACIRFYLFKWIDRLLNGMEKRSEKASSFRKNCKRS